MSSPAAAAPVVSGQTDFTSFVEKGEEGGNTLNLAVEGMKCAGCAFSIEKKLNANENVYARVNVTGRRLELTWEGDAARGNALVEQAEKMGFRFSPVARVNENDAAREKFLLKCIAVSGFASGNIMIFSLALWFSTREEMGGSTRDLMHWFSAVIALPAVIYAGIPFYQSAWAALKNYRANMDVPISLAVVLAAAMSLFETIRHGEYVYFDSSTMLLFLLLCGRYLDTQARAKARSAAGDLLNLMEGTATIVTSEGVRRIPAQEVARGMELVVAAGERVLADGVVSSGETDMDTSAITGETLPRPTIKGDIVFAGMLNLAQPIRVQVEKPAGRTLMDDIVRLMEKAEQGNAAYVRIADRLAEWYTPLVHILAAVTFGGWILAGSPWQVALMNAVTVLIITCPCALGLAVPIVQVVASQRLFKMGILLKAGDALEKLEKVDTVVFDKTGTLTTGKIQVSNFDALSPEDRQLAASLAAASAHPLSRAVTDAAFGIALLDMKVEELAGKGLRGRWQDEDVLLGSPSFVQADAAAEGVSSAVLWFRRGRAAAQRLDLVDALRVDAKDTVDALMKEGLRVEMLSGDRENVAQRTAQALGIQIVHAECNPAQKMTLLEQHASAGRHVLMVGDGLNDAPSLTQAFVSMSPSTAVHITQNAANLVFQGDKLWPVVSALRIARRAQALVRQNFAASFLYNVVAVPLAVAGMVTPLIAAVAMSASSLTVILNALRLNRRKGE